VAHSQYHLHGAYLVEHSDLAGFSNTEQQFLAALVRNQRRAISLESFQALPDRQETSALNCALLLRLAVLLHRSHSREDIPFRSLEASNGKLDLELPEDWLEDHPLTAADLFTEVEYLRERQRKLEIFVS